jgi:hypothetical protein
VVVLNIGFFFHTSLFSDLGAVMTTFSPELTPLGLLCLLCSPVIVFDIQVLCRISFGFFTS